MERFQGTKELKEHLSQMDYPKEIQERLLFQIELVERCNKEGASPTYLVIALTQSDMEELEKEYSISSLYSYNLGTTLESQLAYSNIGK